MAALNSSLIDLTTGRCPDGHCNFFTLPVMNAIEAAKPVISVGLYEYLLAFLLASFLFPPSSFPFVLSSLLPMSFFQFFEFASLMLRFFLHFGVKLSFLIIEKILL